MARPIRVAFILPSFAGGGAERVTLTLLRHLDRARVAPHLIVLSAEGPLAGLVPSDLPMTSLGSQRLRHALPALRRALAAQRPDVAYATIGYTNLALIALRPLLPGRPAVVVREANLPSLSLPRTPWPRLFESAYRLLYPRADRVIASSHRMAGELRGLGVPDDRLALLGNPVDEAAARQAAATPQRVAGRGLRLVAAGRLTQQKGFDRLLEPFGALPPDSHLTIFGDGPDRDALAAAIDAAGLTDRVILAGFTGQLPAALAGADALLLPSRWEGLPNVALEALAVGTPVVATPESGGIAEIAAAAPAGAVTVAAMGSPFTGALQALRPAPPESLRPSLLPAAYRLEAAVAAMEDLLAAAAGRAVR